MAAPTVFRVLSVFSFETSTAIANANALERSANNLSSAADNALLSFQRLGIGLAAQLGLGQAGILGLLGKAVQASERFNATQLQFANILSANKEAFTGSVDTFNERLLVSQSLLTRISETAEKFALPEGELTEFTKNLSAILAPKGLVGPNFQTALDISRGLLKSAPTLGVSPGLVGGQLLRAIEGAAGTGDPLFRRLVGETAAFSDLRGADSARRFNVLPIQERVERLRDGLLQFGSDADVVSGQISSLSGQFQRIKNILFGLNGILRPIGDAIRGPLIRTLTEIGNRLNTEGRTVARALSAIVEDLLESPRQLIVNLLQLQRLGRDVSATGTLFTVGSILVFANALAALALRIPIVGGALNAILKPLGVIGTAVEAVATKLFVFTKVTTIFGQITVFLSRIFVPLAAIFGLFQVFSRAIAIAKVRDAEALPRVLAALAPILEKFRLAVAAIISPITRVIDALADFISPLFSQAFLLESIVIPALTLITDLFEQLGLASVLAQAAFQGLVFTILEAGRQIFAAIREFSLEPLSFSGLGDAFVAGAEDIFDKNRRFLSGVAGFDPDIAPVANNVVNIGSVTIKQDFKQQIEPDRIAFTVQEQLLDLARNPTQSVNRSFEGAFAQ